MWVLHDGEQSGSLPSSLVAAASGPNIAELALPSHPIGRLTSRVWGKRGRADVS